MHGSLLAFAADPGAPRDVNCRDAPCPVKRLTRCRGGIPLADGIYEALKFAAENDPDAAVREAAEKELSKYTSSEPVRLRPEDAEIWIKDADGNRVTRLDAAKNWTWSCASCAVWQISRGTNRPPSSSSRQPARTCF